MMKKKERNIKEGREKRKERKDKREKGREEREWEERKRGWFYGMTTLNNADVSLFSNNHMIPSN